MRSTEGKHAMYPGDYQLVGVELSMFSRKLEAQLRCQNIPWRWHFKTEQNSGAIESRTGTHFIPALITPEKWMLHDTIALGPLLNARFQRAPVIPHTPLQKACCFILEDAFNHWLGRICIHTRWCYPHNVTWVGPRFGANRLLNRSIEQPFTAAELRELAPIGDMMCETFGRKVCEHNGVGPDQEAAVRADYRGLLAALDAHFACNDFLLGDRPCLADFALAGACKAHFVTDPVPIQWSEDYGEMLSAYTARLFGSADLSGADWPTDDTVPDSLHAVLDYLQAGYFQFAAANINAGLAGQKYYHYDYGHGATRARTQKRLNMARLHVQNELLQLDAPHHPSITDLFAGRTILEYYLS